MTVIMNLLKDFEERENVNNVYNNNLDEKKISSIMSGGGKYIEQIEGLENLKKIKTYNQFGGEDDKRYARTAYIWEA